MVSNFRGGDRVVRKRGVGHAQSDRKGVQSKVVGESPMAIPKGSA